VSLSAARLIINVSASQKDGLLESVFSQQPAAEPLYFRGDINALEVFAVKPIDGSNTQFWQPADIDPTALEVGVGDADERPTSGTFALAYDADSTGLTALAFNISAANLQTAINANPAIAAIPDTVLVTLLAVGVYQVAFQAVGARSLFGSDPALLLPESNVFVSRQQTGAASVKEIQIIELVQRPLVYVDTWAATGEVAATVNSIRSGDGSTKALHQITIYPIPYEGTFTVETSDGVSDAIPYNATSDEIADALAGTWTAVKGGEASWTIQRSTVGASSLIAADVDVTGLSIFTGLLGTLTFNTSALFTRFLTEATDSFTSTLQAKFDDGTNRETLLSIEVTIQKEILSAGGLAPSAWPGGFATSADIDAALDTAFENIFTYDAYAVSTAGTTTQSKVDETNRHQTVNVSAGAGAGTYTRVIVLGETDAIEGDIAFVTIQFAASVNPTIEVRDSTAGGTVLYGPLTGTGTAFNVTVQCVYNGAEWITIGAMQY